MTGIIHPNTQQITPDDAKLGDGHLGDHKRRHVANPREVHAAGFRLPSEGHHVHAAACPC